MGEFELDTTSVSAPDRRRLTLVLLVAMLTAVLAVGATAGPAQGQAPPAGCAAGQTAVTVDLPSGAAETFCYAAPSAGAADAPPVAAADSPAIELDKTVGLSKTTCGTASSIVIATGSEVVYCYTASNTGDVTLTSHDLVDNKLGTIFDDLAFALAPGASVSVTESAFVDVTTVNNATWTATDGVNTASASDSATVNLAQEPSAPTGLLLTGVSRNSASLSWTAPAFSGLSPITGYRVLVFESNSPTPSQSLNTGGTGTTYTVNGLSAGTVYRFSVAAVNAIGQGNASPTTPYAVLPFRTLNAFTTQQFQDFAGRAPTTAELTEWRTVLIDGSENGASLANQAVDFSYWQKQSPVIRLYRAYFLRLPDTGGLNYWVGRFRSGTPLNTISNEFAKSNEFKTKYGSLNNRQFVELVYENVLDRPGETDGVNFWTGELDSGKRTRGQVMIGFSESNEYRVKTLPTVNVVNVFTGMVRRVPTGAEATNWVGQLTGGTPRAALVQFLLGSVTYDNRVPA